MSAVNLLSSLREKPTDENLDDGSNPEGKLPTHSFWYILYIYRQWCSILRERSLCSLQNIGPDFFRFPRVLLISCRYHYQLVVVKSYEEFSSLYSLHLINKTCILLCRSQAQQDPKFRPLFLDPNHFCLWSALGTINQ